jgi:hypothetical protein
MAALHLLQRLAVREVHLLSELEEDYPYAVVEVDRLTVGRHRWCILHLQRGESVTKVVIENDFFNEPQELLVCVGVIESALVYTGRNTHGSLTYRILSYDTVIGQLYEQ